MDKFKIERINELTRISRERALTPEEEKERAELRREYIDAMKQSLTLQLNSTVVVRPDGTREKLRKKIPPKQ